MCPNEQQVQCGSCFKFSPNPTVRTYGGKIQLIYFERKILLRELVEFPLSAQKRSKRQFEVFSHFVEEFQSILKREAYQMVVIGICE